MKIFLIALVVCALLATGIYFLLPAGTPGYIDQSREIVDYLSERRFTIGSESGYSDKLKNHLASIMYGEAADKLRKLSPPPSKVLWHYSTISLFDSCADAFLSNVVNQTSRNLMAMVECDRNMLDISYESG